MLVHPGTTDPPRWVGLQGDRHWAVLKPWPSRVIDPGMRSPAPAGRLGHHLRAKVNMTRIVLAVLSAALSATPPSAADVNRAAPPPPVVAGGEALTPVRLIVIRI